MFFENIMFWSLRVHKLLSAHVSFGKYVNIYEVNICNALKLWIRRAYNDELDFYNILSII